MQKRNVSFIKHQLLEMQKSVVHKFAENTWTPLHSVCRRCSLNQVIPDGAAFQAGSGVFSPQWGLKSFNKNGGWGTNCNQWKPVRDISGIPEWNSWNSGPGFSSCAISCSWNSGPWFSSCASTSLLHVHETQAPVFQPVQALHYFIFIDFYVSISDVFLCQCCHCLLLQGTSTTSLMVEVGGCVCCLKKYGIKKDDN